MFSGWNFVFWAKFWAEIYAKKLLCKFFLTGTLPRRFPASLRSLSVNCFEEFGRDVQCMVEKLSVQCPQFASLRLDIGSISREMLRAIGELKKSVGYDLLLSRTYYLKVGFVESTYVLLKSRICWVEHLVLIDDVYRSEWQKLYNSNISDPKP